MSHDRVEYLDRARLPSPNFVRIVIEGRDRAFSTARRAIALLFIYSSWLNQQGTTKGYNLRLITIIN
jgi:hypothetical protein